MKRREFIKKAGVGVGTAAVAAATFNAPFVHAAKKKPVDFALDIYQMPSAQDALKNRLIEGWVKALKMPNPVDGVYLLFEREGYEATYEGCGKAVAAYKAMHKSPPWGSDDSGPVSY